MTNLTGAWHYRSFINDPTPISTAAEALALIFGEGDLTITAASPQAGFHATLSFGGNSVMDLVGTVVAGDANHPLVANVKGHGRPNTPVADFNYDYIFYAVPAWPAGVNQRPALVGTVIRAADHGTSKKGFVASTVTLRKDG